MAMKVKPLPRFRTEDEEREFWATHDSTPYFDASSVVRAVFPNLKPSTETISLRLPKHLLDSIKAAANAKDVPYQSLIKVWLSEKLVERRVQDKEK
jgi:predicted DNA binding CopG/RHH family protein